MERPELAIVIPALNEEATIARVVSEARAFGNVIVVSDGSQDRTAAFAEAAGATVVIHAQNRGYDRALDSGFKAALDLGCRYVVTLDGDGQLDALLVEQFTQALSASHDIVFGVRNRKQRIAERVFGWVTSALYGISDPLCGMKGYRIDVYQRLGHFDSYTSIGTELALYGVSQGCSYTQIPVKTVPRLDSPRFHSALKANYLILRALLLSFRSVKANK